MFKRFMLRDCQRIMRHACTLLISAGCDFPENGNPQTASAQLAPANPPLLPSPWSPSVGTAWYRVDCFSIIGGFKPLSLWS